MTMIHGAPCPSARFVCRPELYIQLAHAHRSSQLLAIFIVVESALSTFMVSIVPWFVSLPWVRRYCCNPDKRQPVPRKSREGTLVDDCQEAKLGSV
jgi:hypothetical protein